MARVLITSVDTTLGADLARRYRDHGDIVVGTTAGAGVPVAGAAHVIPWTPRTPFAARNVILAAANACGALDQCIVVHRPTVERTLLHETPLAAAEEAVDTWLKGYLFLCREVLQHFLDRDPPDDCVLALVTSAEMGADGAQAPVERLVVEGFRGLARSLCSVYAVEGLVVLGMEAGDGDEAEIADYVERTLADSSKLMTGRWFRQRRGLLSGLVRTRPGGGR